MNAIIIDDEPRARELLKTLLKENFSQINVIDLCPDLPNGVKSIRKHKPDLIFLDIEMPGHSGLEILDFFDEQEIKFGIIFTTAYSEFAIKAFKLSAIDYLLKPIEVEELGNAIERFEKKQSKPNSSVENIEVKSHQIAVPIGQSIRFIELNNIMYLKADNSYCEIHLLDDTKLIVSRTLKNFEDVLVNNSMFFRCHKSYMVNRNYVADYVKSDGGFLLLTNKKEIPISNDRVDAFLEQITIVKR